MKYTESGHSLISEGSGKVGSSLNDKVEIQSRDGILSKITIFRNTVEQAPVLILMPAMGVNASFYEPFADALVKQGLNVAMADLRGHGASNIRPGRNADFGYRELVLYDWRCVMAQVKMLFPQSLNIICGHSLGG